MRIICPLIFTSLLFPLTVFSQYEDSLMVEKAYYQNGNKKYEFIYPNGIDYYNYKYWYSNGRLFKDGSANSKVDEDLWEQLNNAWDSLGNQIIQYGNGIFQEFYSDGKLKTKGRYVKHYKYGLWVEYYQNGQLKNKGNYDRWGKKDGEWVFYFANGNISSEGIYDWRPKNAGWKYYHRNGKLQMKLLGADFPQQKIIDGFDTLGNQTLKNGNGYVNEYYRNGKIKIHSHVKDSLRDTICYYYENGSLFKILAYSTALLVEKPYSQYYLINCYDKNGNAVASNEKGWEYFYDEDGNLEHRSYQIERPQDSSTIVYYKTGKIKTINSNAYKRMLGCAYYFNNGTLAYDDRFSYKDDSSTIRCITNWYNGCTKEIIYANDKVERFYPDGRINGIRYEYFRADSVLRFSYVDCCVMNDTFTGAWDSVFIPRNCIWQRSWHEDGTLRSAIYFDTASKNFTLKYFNHNGTIQTQGLLLNKRLLIPPNEKRDPEDDVALIEGFFKSGIWISYDDKGKETSRIDFDKEPVRKRMVEDY